MAPSPSPSPSPSSSSSSSSSLPLKMTWHPGCRRAGPPLGLRNLGNSCYLNSVLQCLTYTPPLAQFCLSSQHSSLCKLLFANREKECSFCILERQIARSLSLDGPLDAPSKIQRCLSLFAENFRWGRQEDAHEFLRYVIDACHNACLKLLRRTASAPGNSATNGIALNGTAAMAKSVLKQEEGAGGPSTVMKEIFGGALLSQVKCLACKGVSNKSDEIMDLCLDLFQSNSLKDALSRFFQPEVLDGNNKYSCSKCKKLSVARKQMFILRAPNVLVIQLKRFEGIHGGKINKNIEFEEVLMLSNFMAKPSQDPQPEYNLIGSIVHSGFSQESGHYYAYIKDASGRWYCCNDAHVSLSSTQEVLSEKVYILFYLRSNQCPKPNKTCSPCNPLKMSDANGTDLSNVKSAESLKSTITKSSGLPSKPNISIVLKNGKVSSGAQIKQTSLKNSELRRDVSKCYDVGDEHSTTNDDKKVGRLVSSGLATSMAIPSATCHQNTQKSVPCGNGFAKSLAIEEHADGDNHSITATERDIDSIHSATNGATKYNADMLPVKKESCNGKAPESSVLCTKDAGNTLVENGICKSLRVNGKRKSQDDLECVIEELAKEAYSGLQTCGWVDKVQNYMHARKKTCIQAVGSSDINSIKQQLIMDAKKTLISQIPELLKGHLIQQFMHLAREKLLLDS